MRRRKFIKQLGIGVASVVVGAPILAEVVPQADFLRPDGVWVPSSTGFTQEMWDQMDVLYVFDEPKHPLMNWKTMTLEEFNKHMHEKKKIS